MKQVNHKGISMLGVMSLVAILLIGVVVVVIILRSRGQDDRDDTRLRHLEIVGLAEEYYFDKHRIYGETASLIAENLLPTDIVDPSSVQRYNLYLNNLKDEWCAWARSEAKNSQYFIRHEAGSGIVINQPTNLATCKSTL